MRAIIFDFDGTILDTDHAIFNSWQQTYHSYGVMLPFDKWLTRIGATEDNFDVLGYLLDHLDETIKPATIIKQQEAQLTQELSKLSPRDGVEEWLREAKKIGLQLAVASNSSKKWIQTHLQRLQLLEFFDVIACRDHVKNLKPLPDVYQHALTELQLQPQEAFAVEDSPLGATAAIAAGLHCVIVPNLLTSQLDFPQTFFKATSLSAISLQNLLQSNFKKT